MHVCVFGCMQKVPEVPPPPPPPPIPRVVDIITAASRRRLFLSQQPKKIHTSLLRILQQKNRSLHASILPIFTVPSPPPHPVPILLLIPLLLLILFFLLLFLLDSLPPLFLFHVSSIFCLALIILNGSLWSSYSSIILILRLHSPYPLSCSLSVFRWRLHSPSPLFPLSLHHLRPSFIIFNSLQSFSSMSSRRNRVFYHAPFPSPPSSMLHLPSSILQPTYSIFFCYRHLRSSHLPYSRGGYGSSSTSSSSYPSPVFTIPPPLRYTTPQPYDLSCQPPSPSS